MNDQDDHAPIEPRYQNLMRRLGKAIDELLNPEALMPTGHIEKSLRHSGFVLLMFKIGEPAGRMNYLSNSDRGDILTSLKELVDKMENDPDFAPRGGPNAKT